MQAVPLAGFMLVGLRAEPIDAMHPSGVFALVAGCLGAYAMGVQNAQARLTLGGGTPTTVTRRPPEIAPQPGHVRHATTRRQAGQRDPQWCL